VIGKQKPGLNVDRSESSQFPSHKLRDLGVIYGGGWMVKVGLEEMGRGGPVPRRGAVYGALVQDDSVTSKSAEPVISLDLSLKQGWVKLSAKSGSSPLAG